MADQIALPPSVIEQYTAMRVLPDGRICGVHQLMFHWTLQIDIHACGYEDRYCYQTEEQATRAMQEWNGTGDPGQGWHRHPISGRRRPQGNPDLEYVEP